MNRRSYLCLYVYDNSKEFKIGIVCFSIYGTKSEKLRFYLGSSSRNFFSPPNSAYLLSNSTFCILTKTFCHIFCVFFSKRYPQRVHMNQNCIQSLDDIRINQLTKQPLFFISVTFRGFLSVVSKWVMVLELVYLVRKIVPKIFPSVITDFVYLSTNQTEEHTFIMDDFHLFDYGRFTTFSSSQEQ